MQYVKAADAADAVRHLVDAKGNGVVLAGGTDLLVQMKSRRVSPGVIVDIKNLPGAMDVQGEAGGYRVGAGVPGAVLGEHSAFVRDWPGVAEAAQLIGSTQIQGRATMVGNLCNASPAADSVPALIAANAVAVVEGPGGQRQVPVASIPTGPGKTSLETGELVTALLLPPRPARSSDAYLRFIPRTEMDIAVAAAGVNLVLDEAGTVIEARVALGAVSATAYLDEAAGARLVGTKLEDDVLADLAALCGQSCSPIDDKRGTVEYRREVVGVLAKRAARIAYQRAKEKA
ncbi:FAD binding domain-containing protein [Silicimonas sp. MF1-12-2]|jgi:carbon-monoxide dehydrogenase medium subunit|uniref:FAD binding domain-containing protein n=1 Tax=Silicimonas sp. MF1-12-2 TaxID=3384793 RepID=UPI0039B6B49D